jgi:SAM-dependent methyltransferase
MSLRSSVLGRIPGARRLVLRWRFGDLTRVDPLSSWGSGRAGGPVDRWYIERFLLAHAALVEGHVLEVKADTYASRLGASTVDVLDIDPHNRSATITGDLCRKGTLPSGAFDCAIVTQTLQMVDDPSASVENLLGALRPGGVLLITVPSLSRIIDRSDRWRWTPHGLRDMLETAVGDRGSVEVSGLGNGLASRAFLFGLGAAEVDPRGLEVQDPLYPIVAAAAVRRHA